MEPKEFIKKIKPHALKIQDEFDIPAAVVIAQSALESGWGKHIPEDKNTGESSKNIFGIKYNGDTDHDYVVSDTQENLNGQWTVVEAQFRKYNDWYESIYDYVQFLIDNPRYEDCFQYSDDPTNFVIELKRAGYATDPAYAEKLISIIKQFDLEK